MTVPRTSGSLPVAEHLRPAPADESPGLALLCTRIAPGGKPGRFYRGFDMQVVPLAALAELPVAGEA